MKIGRRIYFDKATGNVILDTGERQGNVVPTTIEHDIATYKILSEINRETFDHIELEYGQYAQDFAECSGYRVNIEKLTELSEDEKYKAIEFSYPDPDSSKDEQEIVYRKPLSEEIEDLKQSIAELTIFLAGGV